MTTQQKIKMLMIQAGDKGTIKELASLLGISKPTATAKLKGKRSFSTKEIKCIADAYHLSDEEICGIFIREE